MNRPFSWKMLLFFILLFGVLGYLRENFFIYTNEILSSKYYHRELIRLPDIMRPLTHFDYLTLYYLKYPFTLVWIGIFYGASFVCLKKTAGRRLLLKLLSTIYATLLGIAALAMAYSYLVHKRPEVDEYTISRWLLGIAQSPLVCLILLAGHKLIGDSLQLQESKDGTSQTQDTP